MPPFYQVSLSLHKSFLESALGNATAQNVVQYCLHYVITGDSITLNFDNLLFIRLIM